MGETGSSATETIARQQRLFQEPYGSTPAREASPPRPTSFERSDAVRVRAPRSSWAERRADKHSASAHQGALGPSAERVMPPLVGACAPPVSPRFMLGLRSAALRVNGGDRVIRYGNNSAAAAAISGAVRVHPSSRSEPSSPHLIRAEADAVRVRAPRALGPSAERSDAPTRRRLRPGHPLRKQ